MQKDLVLVNSLNEVVFDGVFAKALYYGSLSDADGGL